MALLGIKKLWRLITQLGRRPGEHLSSPLYFVGQKTHIRYRRSNTILWHLPARSPDVNLVEKFWGCLRKQLQRRDLEDMVKCRPVLGKMAYRARIRALCRSAKARQVAKNLAGGLKRVCKEVIKKGGAATRG